MWWNDNQPFTLYKSLIAAATFAASEIREAQSLEIYRKKEKKNTFQTTFLEKKIFEKWEINYILIIMPINQ